MDVYILFDEEFGECEVFLNLEDAKTYMESIDDWKTCTQDDTLWMSESELVYIFKRTIHD